MREWCEAIYAAAREHGGGKDDDDDDDEQDEQEDASVRDSKYLEVQKDASAGDNLRATPPKSASRRTQSKELIQHEELVRAATYEGNLKGQHAKRGSMGIPLLDTNDSLEDLVAAAEKGGGSGRASPQTVMTPPDGSTPGASGGSGTSAEQPPPQHRVQPRSEIVPARSPSDRL